jgi:hypothetical protein
MPLLDRPEFREWFRARHRTEPGDLPELRRGDCHGCGTPGVPLLVEHCLVCVAEDFGIASTEQRIADAIRAFVRVFSHEPPELGNRVVSDLIFDLSQLARLPDTAQASHDTPQSDEQQT